MWLNATITDAKINNQTLEVRLDVSGKIAIAMIDLGTQGQQRLFARLCNAIHGGSGRAIADSDELQGKTCQADVVAIKPNAYHPQHEYLIAVDFLAALAKAEAEADQVAKSKAGQRQSAVGC